ncbi:hypothetical protein GCM10010174_31000 [Kutzneria viridogrisea]|uniref:Secreted protein n=2 Tax=Kutzneria TaxID=43356 RepID=A0ABR6BQ71_9PSEU|nr:hypothetical protein [Kutzneria albida]AHH93556.1 putative secreted protein [Kutzneria albida DSM 43870]MBA8929059.1 hypothetical protein [Kutzneria viridogrisea]
MSVKLRMRGLVAGLAAVAALVGVTATAPAAQASTSGVKMAVVRVYLDVTGLSSTNIWTPAWVDSVQTSPQGGTVYNRLWRLSLAGGDGDPTHLENPGDFQNTWSRVVLEGVPGQGAELDWNTMRVLQLTLDPQNTPPGRQKCVSIGHADVWGQDTNNYYHHLAEDKNGFTFCDRRAWNIGVFPAS